MLPPGAALAVWLGLAWGEGIVRAIRNRQPHIDELYAIAVGTLGVGILPVVAWTIHLLVVLPATWELRDQSAGVARAVVIRAVGIAFVASVIAGWLFHSRVDRVVDTAFVSALFVGLPVATMVLVAAWLQESARRAS